MLKNKIMEDLKQGTRVEFDIQSFKGNGTIVGVATNGQPITLWGK